jgi:hypothetical protein
MAVGVSFGGGDLGSAIARAIGIGLQTFPRGWRSRCQYGGAE